MSSTPKRLSVRGRVPRDQMVLGNCDGCGSARVVMPCSNVDCDAWIAVCDCNDASETSYPSGGRCEACRSLTSESDEAWPHSHRTSRGAFHAHSASDTRRAAKARRATKGGIL